MRYIWRVGWREFAENARTKGFWLGILLFPVILLVASTVPALLMAKGVSTRHFVLVDQDGAFAPAIRRALATRQANDLEEAGRAMEPLQGPGGLAPRMPSTETNGPSKAPGAGHPATARRPAWLEVPLPAGVDEKADVPALESQLRPWLRGDRTLPPTTASPAPKLFAAIIIPRGLGQTNVVGHAIRYWGDNQADTGLRDALQRIVTDEIQSREYRALGVDPAIVAKVEARRAPVTELDPRKAEGSERVGMKDRIRQWAPSFFVYLLWVSIFAVSQMLLNSVIEEKSNRIIEVLLSSVTPHELMLGKLLGVMMTGGVMMLAWMGSIFGMGLVAAIMMPPTAPGGPGNIAADVTALLGSSWLLPAFGAYFVLGYIAYATVFLTVGSLCNTLKDAQNLMGPVMIVLMVPMFLMPFIPRDPNGPIATVTSWIPIYTPFVMMNRIAASPPWIDVVGTGALLVAFDVFVLWACGRIFRLAILRTGQPPRLIEMLKWIKGS